MGWDSFGVVGFDLGPLLQGQTRTAKLKIANSSLIRSQSQGVLLEVPHFASIYKSKKQFGLSFAYDAPMIWNDLPDDVLSAKSLSSFRKKLKTYLFEKAFPP